MRKKWFIWKATATRPPLWGPTRVKKSVLSQCNTPDRKGNCNNKQPLWNTNFTATAAETFLDNNWHIYIYIFLLLLKCRQASALNFWIAPELLYQPPSPTVLYANLLQQFKWTQQASLVATLWLRRPPSKPKRCMAPLKSSIGCLRLRPFLKIWDKAFSLCAVMPCFTQTSCNNSRQEKTPVTTLWLPRPPSRPQRCMALLQTGPCIVEAWPHTKKRLCLRYSEIDTIANNQCCWFCLFTARICLGSDKHDIRMQGCRSV